MATTSKYPDVSAYTAVPGDTRSDRAGRDIQRRVTCDFVATGSGSYYSRSCSNLAAWVKVYRHADGTVTPTSDRRCHRHRAIDERTAERRYWPQGRSSNMFPQYEPFDGMAEAKRLIREAQAEKEEARLSQLSEALTTYAKAILAHADLATDERQALKNIVADLKAGTLVIH